MYETPEVPFVKPYMVYILIVTNISCIFNTFYTENSI